jgi:hypothetical protein
MSRRIKTLPITADKANSHPLSPELKGEIMPTTDELLDALINNCKRPLDLLGENGLLQQLSRECRKNAKPDDERNLTDSLYIDDK